MDFFPHYSCRSWGSTKSFLVPWPENIIFSVWTLPSFHWHQEPQSSRRKVPYMEHLFWKKKKKSSKFNCLKLSVPFAFRKVPKPAETWHFESYDKLPAEGRFRRSYSWLNSNVCSLVINDIRENEPAGTNVKRESYFKHSSF